MRRTRERTSHIGGTASRKIEAIPDVVLQEEEGGKDRRYRKTALCALHPPQFPTLNYLLHALCGRVEPDSEKGS